MKDLFEFEETSISDNSFQKEKIEKKLNELKMKYVNLVNDLKDSSINNIDSIFGYGNPSYNDFSNSTLFLEKINENIEIQEKIGILKDNIQQKIQNIEKMNCISSIPSYDSLKNEISNAMNLVENDKNFSHKNYESSFSSCKENTQSVNEIVQSLNIFKDEINKKISSLDSKFNVKNEEIYKDEIEFLKNEIEKLLLENKECKEKLSELITINNEKESEISESYGAWLRNSSKLDQLENLFVEHKEKFDALDYEKNEIIDSLSNKISNIRNESTIYDEISNDLISENNNKINDSILELINSKFEKIESELSRIKTGNLVQKNINNEVTINNEIINEKPTSEIIKNDNKIQELLTKKTLDILNNSTFEFVRISNQLDAIVEVMPKEFDDLITPLMIVDAEPSIDFNDIKYGLMNIKEHNVFDNFKSKTSDYIYESLKEIRTLKNFNDFIFNSKNFINELIKKNNFLESNVKNRIFSTNEEIFESISWIKFTNIVKEIGESLESIILLINDKLEHIEVLDENCFLELDFSKSNFWFCFVEVFELLNKNMINLTESINLVDLGDFNQDKSYFNELEKQEVDHTKISNDKTSELIKKNRILKTIFQHLQNLEKKIDLYEINELKKIIDNI